jgi:hypothetical protein
MHVDLDSASIKGNGEPSESLTMSKTHELIAWLTGWDIIVCKSKAFELVGVCI